MRLSVVFVPQYIVRYVDAVISPFGTSNLLVMRLVD